MDIIINLLLDLLSFVWGITKVIFPLMIIMEIFKDLKIIDKISKAIKPVTNFFTISENSGISLLVGIVFGLLFGAGTIIQSTKDYNLDKRSVFLICMFLSLCHAVIEDTFIFAAIGANLFIVLGSRVFAGLLTVLILSRVIKQDNDLSNNTEIEIH
ncbi:nucleoside recognition domain-containing protein [Sedimentibacter sp. MB31-C6]|uniref:nucleoside recognition domain-containing protein n=1 Tax=Sedimentibacter sp. MB31-C6 TaxID=3109366 RepID=UPI002DDDA0BC|nr:nucleoside recognition domain-containing protein [Sedimentibacter sp. MB36-C1]WSI03523.1 nucleoside recognition domain-containing protein [Sedimentibacter sp. MB36-C1]